MAISQSDSKGHNTKWVINTHLGENHSIRRQKVCFHGKTNPSFSKMPKEKSPNFTQSGDFHHFLMLCMVTLTFFSVTPHIFGRSFQIQVYVVRTFAQSFNFLILWESLSKWGGGGGGI